MAASQFQTKRGPLYPSSSELTLAPVSWTALPWVCLFFSLFLFHFPVLARARSPLQQLSNAPSLHSILKSTQEHRNAFAWPCCLFQSIYCLLFPSRHLNFLFLEVSAVASFLCHCWNCIIRGHHGGPVGPGQRGFCVSFTLLAFSEASLFFPSTFSFTLPLWPTSLVTLCVS